MGDQVQATQWEREGNAGVVMSDGRRRMTATQSLLEPYRVLDLTEGGYMLAGKVLTDLGSDLLEVEPPGGNPNRNIGPFYGDDPGAA